MGVASVGQSARELLQSERETFLSLTAEWGWSEEEAGSIYTRIENRLGTTSIEELRIDFEDGYGIRSDDDEDRDALQVADELAALKQADRCPDSAGIRIKDFGDNRRRGRRTLELLVGRLVGRFGSLPMEFSVVLPKLTHRDQMRYLIDALEDLEEQYGLDMDSIRIEFMVETPESLLDRDGVCPLRSFAEIAGKRCRGAALGVYDFTSAMGIAPDLQGIRHPVCDHARNIMQLALKPLGIYLSDGSTQEYPEGGNVRAAWDKAYHDVMHSLHSGWYQGWDMHPGHLISRLAANYRFFSQSYDKAKARLGGNASDELMEDAATLSAVRQFTERAEQIGAV